MTDSSGSLLELARKGDPKAIETLISRQLNPKGISVKVNLKNFNLYILTESIDTPNKSNVFPFLEKGIKSLNPELIQKVYVYGKQKDLEAPEWGESFSLAQISSLRTQSNKSSQIKPPSVTNSRPVEQEGINTVNQSKGQDSILKNKLEEIKLLKSEGAITEEEFTHLRAQALGIKPKGIDSDVKGGAVANAIVNINSNQTKESGGCYKQWCLHLIMTIFTGGIWLLVWLVLAVAKI